MMAIALIVVAHGLSGAAALAVNCVLWFILIPMAFRQCRDQWRQMRGLPVKLGHYQKF